MVWKVAGDEKVILLVIPMLLLAACASQDSGMGPGMGGNGMMERHHAEIPAEYAGLTNPIPADKESLERGSELYTVNCASCHGDGGMGMVLQAPHLIPPLRP